MRSTDPGARDMLAYARLIIREAQRHGGQSWLDYDKVFCQQAAFDPTLPWNSLHSGIQAATLTGHTVGVRSLCTLCREPDHMAEDCALAYLEQPPATGRKTIVHTSQLKSTRSRPWSHYDICASWNKGSYIYPNTCRFCHVCSICSLRHMARDCTNPPGPIEYQREAHSQSHKPAPALQK